jgi:hypothetical protein
LRLSLHTREGGHCFYCLRRSPGDRKCLDHVVPQAQGGGNSYRNWCLAAWIAIHKKESRRRRSICVGCSVGGD